MAAALPTAASTKTILVFWAVILALYFVPGKTEEGPPTATGHVPKYVDNGVVHKATFTALFVGGAAGLPGVSELAASAAYPFAVLAALGLVAV